MKPDGVVGRDRIQWSDATGFGGRLAPDTVVESGRNMHNPRSEGRQSDAFQGLRDSLNRGLVEFGELAPVDPEHAAVVWLRPAYELEQSSIFRST